MTLSVPHPTSTGWRASTRRDDDALTAVAAEWDDLYARSATASPFQAGPWMRAWWAAYGSPGRLRVTLVHHDGRLVAAAAWTVHGSRACPILTPLGGDLADHHDVLVDGGPETHRRLAAALLDEPGWAVLRIPESRPGGPARTLFANWPGPTWQRPASTCLRIPAGELPDVLATIPSSTAKTLRKKLRKIDGAGLTVTEVPAGEVADGVRTLLDLHRRQWDGRPVTSEHLTPRFAAFLAGAAPEMVRRGQAVLLHHRADGRTVAAEVLLVAPGFVGAYLFGHEPDLRDRIDVAAMLIRQDLAVTTGRGRPVLDLLRGDEHYKLRWRPVPVPNATLVLIRPGHPVAAGYLGYLRARAAAVAALHRTPRLHRAVLAVHRRLGRRPAAGLAGSARTEAPPVVP